MLFATTGRNAVNNKSPLLSIDPENWLHAIRAISNATNERAIISTNTNIGGLGNSASVLEYDDERARAIASALVLANMNSIPLDWVARCSVGGANLNFYIVKQLPVLQPETYLERIELGGQSATWVEFIIPRVLELTYTSHGLKSFAIDLGYEGEPFTWNDDRRHRLQSELDAAYAHMYRLERDELEWILDAPHPSASFPTLKKNEIRRFGEYRTQRYILEAFDAIQQGEMPSLASVAG